MLLCFPNELVLLDEDDFVLVAQMRPSRGRCLLMQDHSNVRHDDDVLTVLELQNNDLQHSWGGDQNVNAVSAGNSGDT